MLQATVDPLGESTTCAFEYVAEAGFQSSGYASARSVSCPSALGVGVTGVPTSVQLQGLSSGTVYHYRVVAVSVLDGKPGTVEGPDYTFTTQAAGGEPLLPDGRQWELVSPANKLGARLESIGAENVIQATPEGGAIAYEANGPTEAGVAGYNNSVTVLSRRGPGGWSSTDLAIPQSSVTGKSAGQGSEYRLFSEDLSRAAVQPFGQFDPAVSHEATEQTPYLRDTSITGSECTTSSSCFTPLVTASDDTADPCGTYTTNATFTPWSGNAPIKDWVGN